MSALGLTYRVVIQNTTGQTISANNVTVKQRAWKFGTDGSITFEGSAQTIYSNGSTQATATYVNGTTQDNSTNKWIGATLEFTVTAPASSNGDVVLWLDRSVDGGTTWSDNGLGQVIGILNFTTSGTKRRVIHI